MQTTPRWWYQKPRIPEGSDFSRQEVSWLFNGQWDTKMGTSSFIRLCKKRMVLGSPWRYLIAKDWVDALIKLMLHSTSLHHVYTYENPLSESPPYVPEPRIIRKPVRYDCAFTIARIESSRSLSSLQLAYPVSTYRPVHYRSNHISTTKVQRESHICTLWAGYATSRTSRSFLVRELRAWVSEGCRLVNCLRRSQFW